MATSGSPPGSLVPSLPHARSSRPPNWPGSSLPPSPPRPRRTGGHPAKRSFQAIRIEVNRELEVLPHALDAAIAATSTGGRIAVLSYHSGEDRIVKDRFRAAATGDCVCPPGLPCVCGALRLVRLVRRVPKGPTDAEIAGNRRAASARAARRRAHRRDERGSALTMAAVAPLREISDLPEPFRKVRASDLRRGPLERRPMARRTTPIDRAAASSRPHLEVVPQRRRAVGLIVVVCFLLFSLCLGAVAFQTELAQNQLALDKTERAVRTARERYDVLRRQRAELRSPTRLSLEATRLGMQPAQKGDFMTIAPDLAASVAANASGLPNTVAEQSSEFDQFSEVKKVTGDTP